MNRGRPRSEHVDEAVAAAVRELLVEHGYQGLSIDRVAARAGVGKAGIYRRWRSKAEMVFAVVVHGERPVPPADTGTLRGDLAALARHVAALLSAPHARLAMPGLVAELAADPALSERFAAGFVDRERDVLGEILDRAAGRGEIASPASEDVGFAHVLILGPVFAHLFLGGGDMPSDLTDRLAGALVAALGAKE
ncbi:TetR/AcrR family transcriptional regulator [Actinomadura sp. NEAU-AAG7]|uniref:TetR/AcrR family transcriptional regulator n=1 Tax=Actinomadura sp. NEAU-AAG7 TaxID=2839640 RepID=UPI001BE3D7F6|nr:TetR/AcrR family transcriptional regulator [Actinomadura sp. NEAU-AAG7]MBT2209394.1 TetR/AcrR family transcriptional regulator [Actinomadura sp. NEAU-AAG7]